jgi:L-malate glycosyltransferase
MRIAQIIDSLAVGGAERMQETFAFTATSRGILPTIILLSRRSGTHLPQRIASTGVRLVEITGKNLVDPARFFRLVSFLRSERFDVLHAHLTHAIILGSWGGMLTGTPVVSTLHSITTEEHKVLEALSLILGSRRIIAVGNEVRRAHEPRLPGRRLDVVPNPVAAGVHLTDKERNALRRELAGNEHRPILISVGRIEVEKGMTDLLDAVSMLRTNHPDVLLLIAGKGTLEGELNRKIEILELQDNVNMLGIRDDIPRLLAASDIYVSSSHWEGMPISILEAMSAGLPVVATNVGDVPHIINDTNGVIVEPKQPGALAEAIQSLLNDPGTRTAMGASGRNYVAEHNSTDGWFDRLLKIYREAAGK